MPKRNNSFTNISIISTHNIKYTNQFTPNQINFTPGYIFKQKTVFQLQGYNL